MKWQHKARVQNAIAAVPFLSNELYYAVQRCFGGLRQEHIDPFDRMKAAATMIRWAAATGFDVRGKTVLEVGTGRMVDLPTGMWLAGAERVVTVDANPYLSQKLISVARSILRQHPEQVTAIFDGARDPAFQERLSILLGTTVSDEHLLRAMNIEYLAPADAARLPLAPNSVDLHVSYAVMEHIPAEVLEAILLEARRLMRPGGLLLHTIDPSDHFSHDDPTITKINFLQFTDDEWKKWAGNQFMYHNRLRAGDFGRMFAEAGIHILEEDRTLDERSLAALKNGFSVASRFANISPAELATTTYSLIGSFDPQPLRAS